MLGLLVLAVASYLCLARRGFTNLEGDGWAHVSIARRLWDSKVPGYNQLGTVWLPLPHLVVAPFTLSDRLWRSGAAGSIPTMVAAALAGFFFWRLLLLTTGSAIFALAGTAIFALNPNWLYIQTTPMTEPLLLACFTAAVFFCTRFAADGARRHLVLAGVATALASLTRYDGWFLISFATLGVLAVARGALRRKITAAVTFAAIASLAPAYWLVHNRILYSDPLEFLRGPYSAQAIYARQIAETGFRFPTDRNLVASLRYYLEAVRLDCGTLVVLAALTAFLWLLWRRPRPALLAGLLLLTPVVAYTSSLYGGHVSIYMPHLYPFTRFNIRYGLVMLPGLVFLATWAIHEIPSRKVGWLLLALLLGQNLWLARQGAEHIILLEEARINSAREIRIANFAGSFLRRHYDFGNVLVDAGRNSGAIQESPLSFRQTIYEGNYWYWDAARGYPLGIVRWVVTQRGDSLWDWAHSHPVFQESFERVAELPGEVEIFRQRIDAPMRRAGLRRGL